MRPIDADTLENMGYELHRTYQQDANTMVYEVKKIADVPTIEVELNSCKYWDSESHFCALRRPQADPVLRDKENGITYAPVKRGRWIDTGSGQECSVCHEIQYGYDNYRYYCPHCGAKMEDE